ncbi:hypothetical protein KVH07_05415 [Streptomyces olivaceus]|uniref:Transposase n=1 Tax=Streptomyces olivaceus TaxID=47716 RepID=A0ABS7W455_STROV|nr:hypothetical protein [Streptomyces olivaceus]MBZ6098242.1 hypothetical protein [Streptomyces olivaceus]MBZ6098498.1 hypothetical protein [Streptomyces olivaceus]MBZ6119045.1 hypothetical protein [Streptomyces olivaceus]MBZ6120122.1 hypothetical protein [Streptomyces olivaceus]
MRGRLRLLAKYQAGTPPFGESSGSTSRAQRTRLRWASMQAVALRDRVCAMRLK